MTTEMLHDRMARELEALEPLPDLVPAVLREGARAVRRRRLTAGAALAVAAVGLAGGVTRLATHDTAAPKAPPVTSPRPTTTVDRPLAGHHWGARVSEAQWRRAVVDTFEALLPPAYGEVVHDPTLDHDIVSPWGTTGSRRMGFNLAVTGRLTDQPRVRCARHLPDLCRDLAIGKGWTGVLGIGTDKFGVRGGGLTLENDALGFQLNMFPVDSPSMLTASELQRFGESPALRDLIHLGVDYAATRPVTEKVAVHGKVTNMPRPVWP